VHLTHCLTRPYLGLVEGLVEGLRSRGTISNVAYELICEAIANGKFGGGPAVGLFAGALTFFLADGFIANRGAADRKAVNPAALSSAPVTEQPA
jgi:hypothetical protein